MKFLHEMWRFLKARKKIWMAPIILVMTILGGLLILTQGSVVAPFIYTLFKMYILGISAFYHDSAACLIHNGEIISAVQEERFTRIKHDNSFPKQAINSCLEISSIKPEQIDYVVFYEKPFLKFERLLETYLAFAPKGFKSFVSVMPVWIKDKLFQKSFILKELQNLFSEEVDWEKTSFFRTSSFTCRKCFLSLPF